MTGLLAVKLLLAPALVVATSLAGRRWGARLAGVLVVLPIVAGPILLIVARQHGSAFAADAATAATLGIVPLPFFALAFALLAGRFGWPVPLLVGWAAVVACDLVLVHVRVPAVVALLLAAATCVPTAIGLRRLDVGTGPPAGRPPWWDLPARAVATAALVLLLTGLADRLGPAWTGVLSPFPIALSVVVGFAAAQDGRSGVVPLLRGIVPGLNGFALFCFVVAVTVVPLGLWSFLVALAVAVLFAIVLVGAQARR